MVPIDGRLQAEKGLQQALNMDRLLKILPADHVGDALEGVVDHRGEVIGDADIFARQDNIPRPVRASLKFAKVHIGEGELIVGVSKPLARRPKGEAPCERFAPRQAIGLLLSAPGLAL